MYNGSLENVMFLPRYSLDIPRLVFRSDMPAHSPYYGLTTYGPYELPSQPPKTIVILYPNDSGFKDITAKIKDTLEKGYGGYFPRGFTGMFEVDMNFETIDIDSSKYNVLKPEATAEEFYEKYVEVCGDAYECFPVVVMNKVPAGLYESLYTEVKYRFIIEGIPSQVVTYETFSVEDLFKWSIFPLALQIFVKMGGIPFLLYDRLNVSENEITIIIGIGLSRIKLQTEEIRYVGFATVFESSGRWRLIKWSPQPYSRNMLPKMLKTLIRNVVDDVLNSYAVKKPSKIHAIIHYTGKNIGGDEEDAVRDACLKIGQVENINVIPYIVKVQESMYRIYDEDSPCIDKDGQPTHLVKVGTVIRMKDDLYLLHTTGCVAIQTGSGEIKFRPNAQGAPSPLIVSIKRLQGVNYELNDIELIKSVLYMARMNYISVNNPVSRLPISVRYSRMLAYITAKLAYRLGQAKSGNINDIIPDKLKRVLWFI